jgi:hypothetical protein
MCMCVSLRMVLGNWFNFTIENDCICFLAIKR